MGQLLKVPYRILFPAILVFCTIGVSLNYNPFDVFTTAMFGIVGYVWSKRSAKAHRCCSAWCWAR